ncbi:MAG: aspartate-semialdehyde dehydrogenase [Deltaproteobacteria bacterium]|nr:aspartate-semialdehyde dehydrogenase [Deltaproteobacteria bacterium]
MKLGIVGVSGLVGQTLLRVLEERKVVPRELRVYGNQSVGQEIIFCENKIKIEPLRENSFHGLDFVIFTAGKNTSLEWARKAVSDGAIVIDNSSAFRLEPDVPLVVPEVNPHALQNHNGIISNPNCATIQLTVALKPLCDFNLTKIVVTSLQSVTGAGRKGLAQLKSEMRQEPVTQFAFPHPIACNLIPQIDHFLDNLFTFEEMKIVNETKKILELTDLNISATCIRVPTVGAHCQSVYLEFNEPVTASKILQKLAESKGIKICDDPFKSNYPMPVNVNGKDEVFIGRIREAGFENGINIWVCADNLRKGAATNAVQILELVLQD